MILFAAYYCGGYVAGRMARFNGAKQGLAVWMTAWAQWIEQVIALHEMQSQTDSCEVAALAGGALDTRAEEREIVATAFTHWHELLRGHLEGMRDSENSEESRPPLIRQ